MSDSHTPSELDRFFHGLAENAFHGELGLVDPPLVDYVATLLVRFSRNECVRALPHDEPFVCDNVSQMLAFVQYEPPAIAQKEYQHIGDYTLFWVGVYPEALRHFQHPNRPDYLIDYRESGKRAYRMAAMLEQEHASEKKHVFRLLSEEYDACVVGLGRVREAWGDAA
ncbi:MAG: hypothetical protein ABGW78_07900 [Pirellulales bacterium]